MAQEQIQMLKKFPLIIPNADFSEYIGFFCGGSGEVYIHAALPNAPELRDMKMIDCSWDVRLIMKQFEKEFEHWKSTSSSFLKFIEWLQKIVSTNSKAEAKLNVPLKVWENLFDELRKIGENVVSKADTENLAWVELQVMDEADREHTLKVSLMEDSLQFKANVPEHTQQLIQSQANIASAYATFKEQVSRLQMFWNVMEEIDTQCWVLDPPHPSPMDTKRQIAIEPDMSIIIAVDPFLPLAKPDMQLLGSELKAEPLHRIIANLEWPTEGMSLYKKLQESLDVRFPSQPEEQNLSQLSQDEMCCICLLADMLDQRCEACKSIFHLNCLKGWLTSIPNPKITFNRISGKCPVCQGPISCDQ